MMSLWKTVTNFGTQPLQNASNLVTHLLGIQRLFGTQWPGTPGMMGTTSGVVKDLMTSLVHTQRAVCIRGRKQCLCAAQLIL